MPLLGLGRRAQARDLGFELGAASAKTLDLGLGHRILTGCVRGAARVWVATALS